jgi:hypothetical protein
MKASGVFQLALSLILVVPVVAKAQPARLTPFPSKEIIVANYDDKLHWWTFPGVIRDPGLKPFAIVITNDTDRPAIAARIQWNWISADGKPRVLTQDHNSLTAAYGSVVDARSSVLILPNGMAIQKGSSALPRFFFGSHPVANSATQIQVAVDAIILSDGQVIGPDKTHLGAELQGQAAAAAKLKQIINAAKAQGRDPQPQIDNAIAEAPRGSATQRYLVNYAHSRIAGKVQVPPQVQLPHFYRK